MSTALRKGQIQSLNKIQNITVLSGRLWITQTQDAEDYILEAGDCFFAMPQSQVILEALEDTEILLSEPSELHSNPLAQQKDSSIETTRLNKRQVS